jgi:hypothetical protein
VKIKISESRGRTVRVEVDGKDDGWYMLYGRDTEKNLKELFRVIREAHEDKAAADALVGKEFDI